MTNYQASLSLPEATNDHACTNPANPFLDARVPTFADLIARVQTDARLPLQKRYDMTSALRAFARLMGQEPAAMPALPAIYRPKLRELTEPATGLSAKRLSNVKSLVLAAMDRSGGGRRRVAFAPLSKYWIDFNDRLPMFERACMSRFMSWCSATSVTPGEVTDAVMQKYLAAMVEESFIKAPQQRLAATCRLWLKLRTRWPELALPAVTVPHFRKTYVVASRSLPDSFIADLDRFCAHLAGSDLFAEDGPPKPLKPISVKRRRFQIMQLASGAIHKGVSAAHLTDLAALTDPASLRPALTFFIERADNQTTTQIAQFGHIVRVIARHWARPAPEVLKQVEGITRKVRCRQRGMTPKNRERLRQFDDCELLARLLFFSQDRMAALRTTRKADSRAAIEAQVAAAVAILIAAPIRLANLVSLKLGQHIVSTRGGQDGVWHLVLEGHETKNNEPREHILAPETVAILQQYLTIYRPLLARPGNDFLFPGMSGIGHKAPNSLGTAISEHVLKHTGLKVNPHLFRHIAGKLILEATPGAYGIVQDVLGHRDIATTKGHYAGSETAAAARHFDGVVQATRARLHAAHRGTV